MKIINVLALGSSITRGYGNNGRSFVEMLNEYNDDNLKLNVTKEAIDGTPLANRYDDSYLARLKKINLENLKTYDYVVVQLSTNDLHLKNNPYDENNEQTTLGAIVEIIKYVQKNSKAKIVFYTCFVKQNKDYEMLINKLVELKNKYNFDIIDFYNYKIMKEENFKSEMSDDIHPNEKGYKLMLPKFIEYFKNN